MDDVLAATGGDTANLTGRAAELERLGAFVDRASDRGAALLITGGPGVGRSVLLGAACRRAAGAGTRVVRAAGVEFEAEVGYAGLNQLLLSLHDRLDALASPHREALTTALGLDGGHTAGALVVSTAVLALLRDVAAEQPVLVVVDDAQWLDRPSARILGSVARRLGRAAIGVLAAVRNDADCVFLHVGLPEHEVPPLDERAAADLLGSRFPGLAAPVRRRIQAEARGVPLALLELPATMTSAQRLGVDPLPPVLPLSGRLQMLFAGRLRALPVATRRLLLLAALDGTGDLATLHAGSPGDTWLDALAPAERNGLVRVDTAADRLALRHPLIGAAVVELATSGQRRRAHALLAALHADDPERRAWHLAEAVVGPHGPTSASLEVAAHRALRKGDAVRAVHPLLRAADLSPPGAGRARRIAAAAYVGADATGQLSSVPGLVGEARRVSPGTAVEGGREGGAAASAVHALMILSFEAFLAGRWHEAARAAEEGIAWSERLGYGLIAMPGRYCLALLGAVRGDERAVRSLTRDMVDRAAPRGVRMIEHLAAHARGLAALGRADFEAAFRQQTAVTSPGRLAPHVAVAVYTGMDLVEAAVRTGRHTEAEAHVAAMQRAEIFRLGPRLALLAAGSAALVASGEDADVRFRTALAGRGAADHPFEHARVRLAHGEHLRRRSATPAVRQQLTAALATFQRLGARPRAARAEHELRGAGSSRSTADGRGGAALTPREHEIASLAASGLTNKQIAQRLHLSPRTVSGHLYRIFPKLGVATRAGLRDALTAAAPPAGGADDRSEATRDPADGAQDGGAGLTTRP